VHVHEVSAAGGVVRIIATSPDGRSETVWTGVDPLSRPGVFSANFATTPFVVRKLRVELDTRRGRGWNEIDAVEIAGPNGRAWATDAVASSNYGEATPGKSTSRAIEIPWNMGR
jgi:hypothetical protein